MQYIVLPMHTVVLIRIQGYGIATLNSSTPAEASTLYLVGSTTKAFVAAAMTLLVDDNTNYPFLGWTTPIADLLRDDFVLSDPYFTSHVTIEDALSHRTGMPRHDSSYGRLPSGSPMTPRDVVRSLRHLPLTAEIRTKFQYCNMMYVVISSLIETVTGSRLEDFISGRILQPLGMNATYFSSKAAHEAPQHLATGYAYSNGSYRPIPDFDATTVSGAGFMISNVLNYISWLRVMISQSSPISKAGHRALRTPKMLMDFEGPYTGPTAYTLGWMTGTYHGFQWFQHGGGMEAYGANVIYFPELKWGSVAFGNTAGTSNAVEDRLMWYLIDEKLRITEEQRFDWDEKYVAEPSFPNRLHIVSKQLFSEIIFKLCYILKADHIFYYFRYLTMMNDKKSFMSNAKSNFYPSIPSPPLPLSLPLSAYEGTYHHPAYHNMTVVVAASPNDDNSTFTIDRSNQTIAMSISLKHVSGEFFLAYVESTKTAGTLALEDAYPAQFKLRKDGTVGAYGARIELTMEEELIWFDRIA